MPLRKDQYTPSDTQLHDVRLMLPAVGLWAVTAVAAYGGAPAIGVCAVVGGVGLGCAHLIRTPQPAPYSDALSRIGHHYSLRHTGSALLLTILIASVALLPAVLHTEAETRTLWESPTAHHSRVITGKIVARPLHWSASTGQGAPTSSATVTLPEKGNTTTLVTVRTRGGELNLQGKGPPWATLVVGERIEAVVKPLQPPENHFSLGSWKGVYLRSRQPPTGLARYAAAADKRWTAALHGAGKVGMGEQLQVLAKGMSIGDVSGMDTNHRRAYRAAGLSHLTAVSGANITYLLLIVGWGTRSRAPRFRLLASCSALLSFVVMVGPEPAVLRAAVGGTVGLLAVHQGARRHALPALGAGILVLLFLRPSFSVSPGFVLSVVATAGLIWGAPLVDDALSQWGCPSWWAAVLSVALVAHCATLPLTVAFFGTASTLGIVANIVVSPVVPLITFLGLMGVLASVPFPPLGTLVALLMTPFLWWVERVGYRIGTAPGVQTVVPATVANGLISVAVVATIALLSSSAIGRKVLVGVLTVALCVTGWHAGNATISQRRCQASPTSTTIRINANGMVFVRGPLQEVAVLPAKVPARQLSQLPPAKLFVQVDAGSAHGRWGRGSVPNHPAANLGGVVAPRHTLTPQGVSVVRVMPATTFTINERGQICESTVAR